MKKLKSPNLQLFVKRITAQTIYSTNMSVAAPRHGRMKWIGFSNRAIEQRGIEFGIQRDCASFLQIFYIVILNGSFWNACRGDPAGIACCASHTYDCIRFLSTSDYQNNHGQVPNQESLVEDLNSIYTQIDSNVILPYSDQHMEADPSRIDEGEMDLVPFTMFLFHSGRQPKANDDYARGQDR